MKRAIVIDQLEEAQQQIIAGQQRLQEQAKVIAELEQEGEDTTNAQTILRMSVAAQNLRIAQHARLLRSCRKLH
jgi:hypothetical protein